MASKVSAFAVIITISVFFKSAAAANPYEFVKLVLQWPPAYCNAIVRGNFCRSPILDYFVINAFRPMYFEDTPLAPYNESDSCLDDDIFPEAREFVTREEVFDKIASVERYWRYLRTSIPGVRLNNGHNLNLENWKNHWDNDGKCYDDDPLIYFADAIHLFKAHKVDKWLHELEKEGIVPDGGTYEAKAFATAIKKIVGKKPQVRCNKDRANHLQLYEISLCLDNEKQIMDCKKEFNINECKQGDIIRFPAVFA